MKLMPFLKRTMLMPLLVLNIIPNLAYSSVENKEHDDKISPPTIAHQIFEQCIKNENWKTAFLTGKEAQVVFMSVSPKTNPKNEIGMETHEFDQVIFIVEGDAKTDLNGKTDTVKTGDLIFIPQGTPHNVINLNKEKPLKIISIYSHTDIPAHSNLKKSTDSGKE